jgi:hypothetical protein
MRRHLALGVLFVSVGCGESTPPAPRVATTITVTPNTAEIFQLDTLRFSATVKDDRGDVMSGIAIRWQSSDTNRLRIDGNGLATANANSGFDATAITITATAATVAGTALVTWRGELSVWPDTNLLYTGMTRPLIARDVLRPRGSYWPLVQSVAAASWTSSDPGVVTVDNGGQLTAVAPGHARIVMRSGGHMAASEVYVLAAPPPLHFTSVTTGAILVRYERNFPTYRASACGLTDGGAVYCWGPALPSSQPTDRCEQNVRTSPHTYSLLHYRCTELPLRLETDLLFTSLATTGSGSCGLATSKRVYCWGTNASGQLGIGTTDSTLHGVTPIADENEYATLYGATCGLRTSGVLVCWGTGFGATPRVIGGSVSWRTVAAGGQCGLATDSTAYCFRSGVAERVGGTTHWASIATSYLGPTPCALTSTATVMCGSNLETRTFEQPFKTLVTCSSGLYGYGFEDGVCGMTADNGVVSRYGAMDLGGVKVRSFYGHCGISVDDKVYCWSYDGAVVNSTDAGGTTAAPNRFLRVPGQ